MEEIAKSRDLVTGTIATHLEHYVRMGKIKLEQVVAVEKIEKIRRYQRKEREFRSGRNKSGVRRRGLLCRYQICIRSR